MEERRHYESYLLRLWQTADGGDVIWRASLENARTGERLGFARLADLFAYLSQQTSTADEIGPRSLAKGYGQDGPADG